DNSLQICREYESRDARIRVIDQENAGVSAARNNGMDHATGDFVLFVDSDDMIEPDSLERFLAVAEPGVDLVVAGYKTIGRYVPNDTAVLEANKGPIEKGKLFSLMITMVRERVRENMVRCLYRREMLEKHSLRFRRGMRIAEDYLFFLQCIEAAEGIFVLPMDFYTYRVNEFSATASYISCLTDDMVYLDEWVREHLCGKYPQLEEGYQQRRALTYLRSIQNMCLPKSPFTKKEAKKIAKALREEGNYGPALKVAYRRRGELSKVDKLSITMLRFGFDKLYVTLYDKYKKRQQKKAAQ
ncbi:MAG: glycosyltransferase, partial [Clostridia bacterium]|nr:glycosyltransferase [Clostridia bacterium]